VRKLNDGILCSLITVMKLYQWALMQMMAKMKENTAVCCWCFVMVIETKTSYELQASITLNMCALNWSLPTEGWPG